MRARAVAVTVVLAGAALLLAGGPAGAAPGTTTHWSAPAEGALSCGSLALTLTGGTFEGVEHLSYDAQGVEHRSDSDRFADVTASDGQRTYVLTGGGGSGGTEGSDHGRTAHLEAHVVVHDPAGGVLGRIALLQHVYRDGTLRTVDSGSCHVEG